MWFLVYSYNQYFGIRGIRHFQIENVSRDDVSSAAKAALKHLKNVEEGIRKNPLPNHGKNSYRNFSLEWQELFEENFNKAKSRLKELSEQ
ncbi:hypothetical protein KKH14_00885 [Patescibacteria group bacterium]|nr:hypothetical protein [Patescibacteria group bacterium]